MEPKCNKYSDNQTFAYLQGRCTAGEEEAIQLHIMSCKYCFEKIAKLRQLSNKLVESDETVNNNEIKHLKRKRLFNPMVLTISSAAAIIAVAIIAYNKLAPEGTSIPIGKNPGSIYHNIDSVQIKKDSTIVIDQFDEIEVIDQE